MAEPPYLPYSKPARKAVPLHLQPSGAQYNAAPPSNVYSHSRSRTTSSNTFPISPYPHVQQPQHSGNMLANPNSYTSRRTISTNTFSTTSSNGNGPVLPRQSMSSNYTSAGTSADLRRSTSSRSGGSSASSYVSMMRKQKATVWCDRAQHEDPRLLQAQKLAKIRAANEVLGGGGGGGGAAGGRTATMAGNLAGSNRVTAKIRHHGKAGLVGYSGSENFGIGVGGVPMRLSASEVEGGDEDNEDPATGAIVRGGQMYHHHRSGSGRSSVGSGRKGLTYRQSGASGNSGRWSSGNTPPSEFETLDSLTEGETPVPANHSRNNIQQDGYFQAGDRQSAHSSGHSLAASNKSAGSGGSGGSGSSGERRDELPSLDTSGSAAARLASRTLLANTNLVAREKSVRNPEELRRRGSVDERTMTMSMSAGRLFVANPDLDD